MFSLLRDLLQVISGADAVFAIGLGLLLIAGATPCKHLVTMKVYRWAFAVGLVFSLGWWVCLLAWLYAGEGYSKPDEAVAFDVVVLLPASVLGAEAGMAGWIGLSKPWSVLSVLFAIPNGALTLVILVLIVGARSFSG